MSNVMCKKGQTLWEESFRSAASRRLMARVFMLAIVWRTVHSVVMTEDNDDKGQEKELRRKRSREASYRAYEQEDKCCRK